MSELLTYAGRPALSLVSTPGKRAGVLGAALEAERLGFPAIASPGLGASMALCASLAHVTSTIRFFTAIQPIYMSSPNEAGLMASYVAETSSGRFGLGLGVSHEVMNRRILGAQPGNPLSDVREYVDALRAAERFSGPLPPIYLAAMRDRMLTLAAEIADGVIWANAARSDLPSQLARVPSAGRDGFFRANMIPTVIDEDRAAAAAVNRRTMTVYVGLPNYRNYWRGAGYAEEMDAIEAALGAGDRDRVTSLMSDRWLADVTLFGSASEVREGFDACAEQGVLPIAVMSSTRGGQLAAVEELFSIFR
jgi:alkanesulfonate monooxygenase SsuD/methylene tetrahydromethanopterin reductase-like flavin-dependent oxidoreductase (luciferase family)